MYDYKKLNYILNLIILKYQNLITKYNILYNKMYEY